MAYKLVAPDKIPLAQDISESPEDIIKAYRIATGLSILCVKEGGIGLSATQVGLPLKIFVVKSDIFAENYVAGFDHYINCRYEAVGNEKYESQEGCLSLIDKYGELRYFIVPRPKEIRFIGKKIIAKNPLVLQEFDVVLDQSKGLAVYAHETDHSYGITIDKIGVEQGVVSSKKKKK